MPTSAHALIVIIDGRMENPEFVVWGLDDFNEEMWKWKKRLHEHLSNKRVEYWAKKGKRFYKINPFAV